MTVPPSGVPADTWSRLAPGVRSGWADLSEDDRAHLLDAARHTADVPTWDAAAAAVDAKADPDTQAALDAFLAGMDDSWPYAPGEYEPVPTDLSDIVDEPPLRILWDDEIDGLEPPVPLVERWLDQGAFAVLYGPPGGGKSFWAISLALHIASDMPTFFGNAIHSSGGSVVYLAAEGATGLGRRRAAWIAHHDVTPGRHRMAWVPETVDLRTDQGAAALLWALDQTEPVLLVIDTLNRNAPGTDEGAEDIGRIIATIDMLRRHHPNVTVLLVHHSGKDATRGARGHSALLGAVDTEISLKPVPGGFTVETTKQKEGPLTGPVTLGLTEAAESVAVTADVDQATAGDDLDLWLVAVADQREAATPVNVRGELGIEGHVENRLAGRAVDKGWAEPDSPRLRVLTPTGRDRLRIAHQRLNGEQTNHTDVDLDDF